MPFSIVDILNARPIPGVEVPVGTPGNGKNAVRTHIFEPVKPAKLLGLTYKPAAETVYDTVAQAIELGWKQ